MCRVVQDTAYTTRFHVRRRGKDKVRALSHLTLDPPVSPYNILFKSSSLCPHHRVHLNSYRRRKRGVPVNKKKGSGTPAASKTLPGYSFVVRTAKVYALRLLRQAVRAYLSLSLSIHRDDLQDAICVDASLLHAPSVAVL